ncbi:hypothetical protein [uncultured Cocleimonas sp.]|uniref:hypothetical protein n=1 Tax=uncultured Cocleimonas sp. TaxID=1051587 RepID=UPI00260E4CA8|nr:hypothetical protein [uncultured Cocleimonas sp.]
MKENDIKLIVKILMFIGFLLIVIGVGLIFFTNMQITITGVLVITSILGIGIFIAIPSKIYLTIQALKKNA